MYAKVNSLGIIGLDAYKVEVEADTSSGLPAFDIVGLPDTAVNESKNRVRAAIKNSGYKFPVSRITVNLAPADVRKTGSVYDLPILIAILLATKQISYDFRNSYFIGELSLEGKLRPINGVLPMAISIEQNKSSNLFLPIDNSFEASLAKGINVFGAPSVSSIISHFKGEEPISPITPPEFPSPYIDNVLDFSDVRGQAVPKRAVEIAVAGGHNILMIGPPGSGKSMIAKRIPSIMPPLLYEESLETTKIYSIAGLVDRKNPLITARPFRSPHHTVSPAGLTGGGSIPKPGEISLSHNGVLFLDELPEFSRTSMEVLRQPLEDGKITISRATASLTYPCSLMLVAAMNPCPCGNFGSKTKVCSCSNLAVEKYLSRISGPLLDRIDMHVEVPAVDYKSLSSEEKSESSSSIRERVVKARSIQKARYSDKGYFCNKDASSSVIKSACRMSAEAESMLKLAFERLSLSARAYTKVLKISRTIADLEGSESVEKSHIAEAISFRTLDRKYFVR
jgi:magnesium chelatase family protein